MSEQIDLSRPDALTLLNAANGNARFYLGEPEHGLADYTVRDRDLFGQPDVIARYFGLPDAIADVARRNEEARRETAARQMNVYLAMTALPARRVPFDAAAVPAAWLWYGGIGLVVAIALAVVHAIMGWPA